MDRATPEHLLSLGEDEFLRYVIADARGRIRYEALRDPMVSERWLNTLAGKKKDLERQLGSRKARMKALRTTTASRQQIAREARAYETWRTNALELLRRLEARITEARGLLLSLAVEHR